MALTDALPPAWFGDVKSRKTVTVAQPTRSGMRLVDDIRARHGVYVTAPDDRRLLDVSDLLDLLDKVESGRLVLDEREVR